MNADVNFWVVNCSAWYFCACLEKFIYFNLKSNNDRSGHDGEHEDLLATRSSMDRQVKDSADFLICTYLSLRRQYNFSVSGSQCGLTEFLIVVSLVEI